MKKIITLSEQDLHNIIKNVIRESFEDISVNRALNAAYESDKERNGNLDIYLKNKYPNQGNKFYNRKYKQSLNLKSSSKIAFYNKLITIIKNMLLKGELKQSDKWGNVCDKIALNLSGNAELNAFERLPSMFDFIGAEWFYRYLNGGDNATIKDAISFLEFMSEDENDRLKISMKRDYMLFDDDK